MRARAFLTVTETVAAALWTGSSAGFAFVSAPLAFAAIEDREVFAELTERSLSRLATWANVSGGIAVAAAVAQRRFVRAGIGAAALGLLSYHQRAIVPAMSDVQRRIGSWSDARDDDPLRTEYQALHRRSTRVFGLALLLGLVQLALTAAHD